MDRLSELPIEIIHTIFSFLTTNEALRKSILSKSIMHAISTIPNLHFVNEKPWSLQYFIGLHNYVDKTLTRYQQHSIPSQTVFIDTHVERDSVATILEQCICKIKKLHGVKEVHLHIAFASYLEPSITIFNAIFALKELRVLKLRYGELSRGVVDEGVINCFSLRILKLAGIKIEEGVLQLLLAYCPLLEKLAIYDCELVDGTIRVANLPNLKSFGCVFNNEIIFSIDSTLNLKKIYLENACISDQQFHNLLAMLPILEKLTLYKCVPIEIINVSSRWLTFLSLNHCRSLVEVKLDAPNLMHFEFVGHKLPLLSFASGGPGLIKSTVNLHLYNLDQASSFLELSESLMTFKRSDSISFLFASEDIYFEDNKIDDLRVRKPEFDELFITVASPSSTYSTIMEALLWTCSPKILSIKNYTKYSWNNKFMKYLCEELLVEHDPDYSTTTSFNVGAECWRNYFKHAKFEGRDDEWHPLHSWKNLEDVLQNIGNDQILSLSHA